MWKITDWGGGFGQKSAILKLQMRLMEQPGRDDRRLNHVVPSSTVLLYNYVDGQRGLCSALLCVVGRKYEIWRLIKKIKQESRQNGFEIHLAKYT